MKNHAYKEPDEDDVWSISNPTPAQREAGSVADWNRTLRNGTKLTDSCNANLLSEFKGFLRSALEDPRDGLRLSPGSVRVTVDALTELASFLVEEGLGSISQITSTVSWEYLDYIEDEYVEGKSHVGRHRELTHSSAYKLLLPLAKLFAQRSAMAELKLEFLPEPPFDGMSIYEVVRDVMGLPNDGKLAPIPDEVAVPVLSRAYRWVSVGANDVIELQRQVLACYGSLPRQQADSLASDVIRDFRFSLDPSTDKEWHPPIAARTRTMIDGRQVALNHLQAFRRLVLEMQAACAICIQGGIGIRAHELLAFQAGRPLDKEIPSIVQTRKSSDGLMELFFVSGITAKREVSKTEWLAGIRPLGASALPPAVKALDVVDVLMRPWRELGSKTEMFVSFSAAKGLPRSASSIGNMLACANTYAQKEFALNALLEAGLSESDAFSSARRVRGHRWRTTFALFVFRTSPSLLMALRDHFKHVSDAVTEQGYIGNDAGLLDSVESERVQETGRMMLQISMGQVVGVGTLHHLAKKHMEGLKSQIEASEGDTPIEKAVAFVEMADIRIYNGPYSACFMAINPAQSTCNEMSGIPELARLRPDFAQRSPTVCAGCACAWILPEHREFWQRRLVENEELVRKERGSEFFAEYSIAAARVKQSLAIINALDRREKSAHGGDPDENS